MRLGGKAGDRLRVRWCLVAPLAGASQGAAYRGRGGGQACLEFLWKRPKQTVRASPGNGAGPGEVPQRKDRAEREPKALDSFTYLKKCPDFVSLVCKMMGSIQECIQI